MRDYEKIMEELVSCRPKEPGPDDMAEFGLDMISSYLESKRRRDKCEERDLCLR